MADYKPAAIVILSVAFLLSLGINVAPEDTHTCLNRSISYHCDSLTPYYGLDNGKCVHNLLSNKVCRSGWEEIDRSEPIIISGDTNIVNANGGTFDCPIGELTKYTRCIKQDGKEGYLGELI